MRSNLGLVAIVLALAVAAVALIATPSHAAEVAAALSAAALVTAVATVVATLIDAPNWDRIEQEVTRIGGTLEQHVATRSPPAPEPAPPIDRVTVITCAAAVALVAALIAARTGR